MVDFAGGVLGPLSCLARLPQGCIISTFKFWLIQLLKGGGRGRQYYRIVALIYVNRYYKKVFTYVGALVSIEMMMSSRYHLLHEGSVFFTFTYKCVQMWTFFFTKSHKL